MRDDGSIFPYTYTTGDPKFFIGVHAALFIKPTRRLAANTARWQYLLSGKGPPLPFYKIPKFLEAFDSRMRNINAQSLLALLGIDPPLTPSGTPGPLPPLMVRDMMLQIDRIGYRATFKKRTPFHVHIQCAGESRVPCRTEYAETPTGRKIASEYSADGSLIRYIVAPDARTSTSKPQRPPP